MLKITKNADIVLHAAATAYEGLSVFSPHFITKNIFDATSSLLSASITNNVKRFIFFSNTEDCAIADNLLSNLKIEKNNLNLFKTNKISDKEIFITLSYPNEIVRSDYIVSNNSKIYLFDLITFIAIKNGMHDPNGYIFSSFENFTEKSTIDLKKIYNIIFKYFLKTNK